MNKMDILTLFPDAISDDVIWFKKAVDKLNGKMEMKEANDLKESLEVGHSPYTILNR